MCENKEEENNITEETVIYFKEVLLSKEIGLVLSENKDKYNRLYKNETDLKEWNVKEEESNITSETVKYFMEVLLSKEISWVKCENKEEYNRLHN